MGVGLESDKEKGVHTYPVIYDRVLTQLSRAVRESVGGAQGQLFPWLRLTSKGGIVDEFLETHF